MSKALEAFNKIFVHYEEEDYYMIPGDVSSKFKKEIEIIKQALQQPTDSEVLIKVWNMLLENMSILLPDEEELKIIEEFEVLVNSLTKEDKSAKDMLKINFFDYIYGEVCNTGNYDNIYKLCLNYEKQLKELEK